nr:MAG TPA: hypothetical protein [Bacteriophage sp.]
MNTMKFIWTRHHSFSISLSSVEIPRSFNRIINFI